jgi:hypothetical protein
VKSTRNEEYSKGEENQGESQSKVVLVIPEMECDSGAVLAELAQIHPGTKRERPALVHLRAGAQDPDRSVPEMAAASLPRVLRNADLEI